MNQALRNIVSAADLTIQGAERLPEHGLPLGNGRMGTLVWLTPTALHMQINRQDVFACSSASRSVGITDSDFSCGCAFVDLEFGSLHAPVFGAGTSQHLSVYDGKILIQGEDITVSLQADMEEDAFLIRVRDSRKNNEVCSVRLRTLRYESQYAVGMRDYTHPSLEKEGTVSYKRQQHLLAKSVLREAEDRISLLQEFTEKDYFCSSLVEIGSDVPGMKTGNRNYTESIMEFPGDAEEINIIITSGAGLDREWERETALDQLLADDFDRLCGQSEAWWHAFWNGAPIMVMESEDGQAQEITRQILYFTYIMAATSRGRFMPRYGGLLFQTDGDFKMWGSQYWWHNNSCYYAALMSMGLTELAEPLASTILYGKKGWENAARQQWGSAGMWIPETFWFNGAEEIPENLRQEFQQLYREEKAWSERSEAFMAFSEGRNSFDPRFGWIAHRGEERTERGVGPFGYVNHIFSSGAKIAYWLWLQYQYTLDERFLREKAYPVLRGVADFYAHLPLMERGDDGMLHIRHCNNHESIWGGSDTISELTAIHGILPIAIRAAGILHMDENRVKCWEAFLSQVTPLPTTRTKGALLIGLEENECWVNGVLPYRKGHLDTNHLAEPLFLYDYVTPETENPALRELADNTLQVIIRSMTRENGEVVLGTLDLAEEAVARSCDPAAFEKFIIAMNRNASMEEEFCDLTGIGYMLELSNRMSLREGPQSIGVQKQGHLASSAANALCHAFPPKPGGEPVLYLFSSLPSGWDASVRMNTVNRWKVEANARKGEAVSISLRWIPPEKDASSQKPVPLRVHNPWRGNVTVIYDDGKETMEGKTLIIRKNCILKKTGV